MNILILASASPRRKELLQNVGIPLNVIPSSVQESEHGNGTPRDQVLNWAYLKAKSVSDLFPDSWVLGADTIVVIDNKILGKPRNREDASRMLRILSGRKHSVLSSFCILHGNRGARVDGCIETKVVFKELTDDEIRGYVATGEPLDKAGGYAIQGVGSFLVKSINGSYTNVVGLPLAEVLEELSRMGVSKPFEAFWRRENPGKGKKCQ